MKKQRFTGPMGNHIKQHLALRRSLGFIYKNAEYNLDAFDQHLAIKYPNCKIISCQMVVTYLASINSHANKSKADHIVSLRQFCRYMLQYNTNTYIPEKGLMRPGKVQVKPHIFTEKEIVQLIEQARKMRIGWKTLLPNTYATIIGLLWITGLRIGEVVKLKFEDVDLTNGLVYIRQTKYFKSRIVPLSLSSINALGIYKKQRASFGFSEAPDASFFFNGRGKPCITATTPRVIKELMIKAGLKTIDGKTPRVHDIRHSFATRWLQDFYKEGKDPAAYLAILATYMGHTNIANTQTYLHPSIETLNIAGQKLKFYGHSIKEKNNATSK